jgi:hypothetical protein
MTRRKVVSEKTLELNLCALFLERVRTWPGCSGAIWMGMKQKQEARNGIDELLRNVPSARHLALQFKAAHSRRPDQEPYCFGIGEDQNARLQRLAAHRPQAVHYVLPNYNTFTRLLTDAPALDLHTYLLPVAETSSLGCAIGGTTSHRAEIHESPLRATLFSEPLEVEVASAKSFFGGPDGPFNNGLSDALLSNNDLRIWMEEVALADVSPRVIGQRLRGFGTIVIPRGV